MRTGRRLDVGNVIADDETHYSRRRGHLVIGSNKKQVLQAITSRTIKVMSSLLRLEILSVFDESCKGGDQPFGDTASHFMR